MNDGVAVMLAQAHVRIAMILASGLGGGRAALHNGVLQIQNIEPGNVNGLPMSKLERTLNKISTTPGTFESETMVSGYNLERELVELVNMFRFVSPPILDVAVKRPLRTKDLSRILSLNTGDHDELRSVLIGLQSDSESMGVLNHVAYILCKRSALIAGNVFAGAVAATPGIFPDDGHPFVWPIEGPPFWKISGYHQTVKSVVEDRLNRPVDFTPASGRYGAAFGAIRMLNERHHYF
jgi:hypothetical protein